jgi:hypothetical protein
MKKLFPIFILIIAVSLSGCAWTKRHMPWHHHAATASNATKPAPGAYKTIVTPDDSLVAKVVKVNTVGRFVVLNFPVGQMPKPDQHLFLYRGELKAAEVKIDGQPSETLIVADILSGDAQVGDTVRDQ